MDLLKSLSPFFVTLVAQAASTGYFVWEGCWLLIELLKGDLGKKVKGKRALELGAGTGLAGLCAAAIGGHVLLTDVKSVVTGMLERNIAANCTGEARGSTELSEQESSYALDVALQHSVSDLRFEDHSTPWPQSVVLGSGTVSSAALDWTDEVREASSINDHGKIPRFICSRMM